jgi:hypothetical protein
MSDKKIPADCPGGRRASLSPPYLYNSVKSTSEMIKGRLRLISEVRPVFAG